MSSVRSKENSGTGGQARPRLVIFGCGYVGSALVPAASSLGFEVSVLSRNADALAALTAVPPERRIVADLAERNWHERLAGEWAFAINLVSSAGGGISGYRHSYVEGNRSIGVWARGCRVGHFLYTSATSVYPHSDGRWVSEEDVPPFAQQSANGGVLLEAEELVRSFDGFAARAAILRLAGIYGPGRHLFVDRLLQGEHTFPGDGEAWLNLIHRDDIVAALVAFLRQPAAFSGQVFNVVDNQPVRKRDIVDWLAGQLQLPPVVFNPALEDPRAPRRRSGGVLPNRRVSNTRLRATGCWQPGYPDFRAGYGAILADLKRGGRL